MTLKTSSGVDVSEKTLVPYTLENLQQDPEFRADWAAVLRIFDQYRLNEAILLHFTTAATRKGSVDDIIKLSGVDLLRQEGALELWDILRYGMLPRLDQDSVVPTNDGEL